MRRNIKKLITLLIMSALIITSIPAAGLAEDDENQTIDFVLVIDSSGSLNRSDPDKLGIAAARMFIDLLPLNNARVGVLVFGSNATKPYEPHDDRFEDVDFSRVQLVSELKDAGNNSTRSSVKSAIEKNAENTGSSTYIGPALEAAVDMLDDGGATTKNACIILMSDGRHSELKGTDDEGINNALTLAQDDDCDWPIYSIELNYDGKNNQDNWDGRGRKLLDYVVSKTGGVRIEVKDADEIVQAFASIFARYIEIMPVVEELQIGADGAVTHSFTIPDLASEANFVITGSEFTKIKVRDPNGEEMQFSETIETKRQRFIIDRGKYASLKLVRPTLGDWEITIYGSAGEKVYLQIISAHEMDLSLSVSPVANDEHVNKNTIISASAAFLYNGDVITSKTFYPNNPAFVILKRDGEEVYRQQMTGDENGYHADVALEQSGEIDVYVLLENNMFRDGKKISNSYEYNVDDIRPELLDGLADIKLHVNELSEPIDIASHILNTDGDELTYTVAGASGSTESPFECVTDEHGMLRIKAGQTGGDYAIRLIIQDPEMLREGDRSLYADMNISVTNNAPQMDKRIQDMVFKGAGPFGGSVALQSIDLSEHFSDPDGLPLSYEFEIDPVADGLKLDLNGSSLDVMASGKCSSKVKVTAVDSAGESVIDEFHVTYVSWAVGFLGDYWYALVALAAVILIAVALLLSKRVKGRWEVSIQEGSLFLQEYFQSLSAIRNKYLRKSKFQLIMLLEEAIRKNEYELQTFDLHLVDRNIMLCGTIFARSCTVKLPPRRGSFNDARKDGEPIDEKETKLILKSGESLTLYFMGGGVNIVVTLTPNF